MLSSTYPISSVCRVLELPRSTHSYTPVTADEQAVQQALEQVAQQFPTYGSRRLTAQLRRAPYRLIINRKRATSDGRTGIDPAAQATPVFYDQQCPCLCALSQPGG